ncbi:MAG: hypothetical protein WBL61_01215 [Bryobacteraceae bacterium]
MKRAYLCVAIALLAGFSLHGQSGTSMVVQDILGGTSLAPGSLAQLIAYFYPGLTPTVTVGGQNAYVGSTSAVFYAIQIPVNAPTGANIPVVMAGSIEGGSSVVTLSQYAPILMPQATGATTVSAWHSNGSPVSADAPAMPNETINMYAVGLGPTIPVIATGGSGNGRTTSVPTVTLAGSQCKVLYAVLGMAGVGVYQVYFTMPPNAPSGNQNISVGIGGIASNALILAVGPNPAITAVLNNYSYILPGQQNYGIAPGSIFAIFGSAMAAPGVPAVLQDSSKGLPLTLNGASVAVTVAGVTVNPALYYATPTQIAAVLPSNTPVGTGSVTVTNNGLASAPASIQVVLSAMGLATMSGDGTGQVLATDANYNFVSPTSAAASGQIITLWGSGLGADTAVSDTTYTAPRQMNVPLTVYVGSSTVPVVWAGRSGYPGLDQINIQLPAPNYTLSTSPLPRGCSASLTAADSATGVGSNSVTLPIAMGGGPCMYPSFVIDPSVAQAFSGKAAVNFGSLSISQEGSQAMAGGYFETIPGSALAAFAGSAPASAGSCIAVPAGTYQTTALAPSPYINFTGPAGQQVLEEDGNGDFGGVVPASVVPASGGTFTFAPQAAPGQWSVGPFSTAVNYPAPLDWTNQKSVGVISRAQGAQLTWTGGDADGVVAIRGTSFAAPGSPTPSASFMCSVPASIGEFTVPASVLQTLPVGAGTLTVENQSATQSITATGLDIGYAFAGALFTINTVYN